MMGNEPSHSPPSGIPPRRSSNVHGHGHIRQSTTSQDLSHAKPAIFQTPSESRWIARSLDPRATALPMSPHHTSPFSPSLADAFDKRSYNAINAKESTWSEEKEKIVLGPYDYMEEHPGKDIRKQMISAFNAWLQVPPASLTIITKVIGMLHTSSLLIDDVEDSSLLRRGVPVAHMIFGTAQTINSANYIYFTALQELLNLGNSRAIEIYTKELCNLHRGQGMEIFWRDTLTCPSETDYLEMVGNKTGGLFRLAVKLMQAESKSEKNYIPLVNTIGLLFQIRDDYMNLNSPLYTSNKGLCEDLTEGKFSFPIIHSIRANSSNRQLINILKQKTSDEEVKRYAVKYMESTGSFEYCRQVVKELKAKAVDMVEKLDKGEEGGGKGEAIRLILERMMEDI